MCDLAGSQRAMAVAQMPVSSFAFMALAVFLIGAAPVTAADNPVAAAQAFIVTLSDNEAKTVLAPFDSADRKAVRFTPGGRGGLTLKAMDAQTRQAAMQFLGATLSAEGIEMVTKIRQREEILGRMTGNPGYRDPDLYYLALFGDPGSGPWGYRFEGHHLSVNMTYRGDQLISGVPVMLASNPEKTDAPDAPAELLGPLVEDARQAASDPEARKRVIAALTAHIPGALRDTYRADLAARPTLREFDDTWSGFDLLGGNAKLEIETNQTNHIHITFRDEISDFGGGR